LILQDQGTYGVNYAPRECNIPRHQRVPLRSEMKNFALTAVGRLYHAKRQRSISNHNNRLVPFSYRPDTNGHISSLAHLWPGMIIDSMLERYNGRQFKTHAPPPVLSALAVNWTGSRLPVWSGSGPCLTAFSGMACPMGHFETDPVPFPEASQYGMLNP
jgi:hypothetical protein